MLRLIDALCRRRGDARSSARPARAAGASFAWQGASTGSGSAATACAKSRAETCSRCGAVREAATRDEHGQPLCPHCLITDPANQETCVGCGRRRPVSVRTADGPLCGTCLPAGADPDLLDLRRSARPCVISKATGQPWCHACQQRWIRCAGCGQVAPIRGGTLDRAGLRDLHPPRPRFWHSCPGCGQPGRLRHRRCARCSVTQRLHELLADDTGTIRPSCRPCTEHLAATRAARHRAAPGSTKAPRPRSCVSSRRTRAHPRRARRAARRQDRSAPAQRPGRHRHAARPRRAPGPARTLDHRHHRRTRRSRPAAAAAPLRHLAPAAPAAPPHTTAPTPPTARRRRPAARPSRDHPAGLAHRPRPSLPATARQGDLDTWLTSEQRHTAARPGTSCAGPRQPEADQPRFRRHQMGRPDRRHRHRGPLGTGPPAAARRHHQTRRPRRRAARPALRPMARRDQPPHPRPRRHRRTTRCRLRLGREPVVLPEPLAALVRELVASRRGHAALGDREPRRGCSPAGDPADPISAVRTSPNGSANSDSAPAGPLHRAVPASPPNCPPPCSPALLGIHISVAVAWQRASSGDWTNYAAEVSRRTDR